MGRVVFEHPDGRSVGGDEADFDDPARNPFNDSHNVISGDAGQASPMAVTAVAARPAEEQISLKAEGFRIAWDIANHDYTVVVDDVLMDGTQVKRTVDIKAGQEVARDTDHEPHRKG